MSSPLDAISDVQEILGYEFQNPQLLLEALKTAGAGFNMRRGMAPLDGNKRVAQVGSAVVKVALIDDWYRSMTDRAFANELISRIGSQSYLCDCGRRAGLDTYIITAPCHGDQPPPPSVIAITLQALFGAVWYDSEKNLQSVRQVYQKLDPTWVFQM